jgi:DNA-binding transcriptional ArsR family regulator
MSCVIWRECVTVRAAGDYEALARLFKAMGHPTRLGLLKRISTGSFCVSELQRHLDQSQSSISQHLAILRDRGLIVPERRGNMTCYYLADERIADLLALAETLLTAKAQTRAEVGKT